MKWGRRHKSHTYYYNSSENKHETEHSEDLLSGFDDVTVTRVLYKRKNLSRLGKLFVVMYTDSEPKSWSVGAMAVIPALKSENNLTKCRRELVS